MAAAATSGSASRAPRRKVKIGHYTGLPVRSRVIWRRSATAIGVYVATGFGFLATVVSTRELGLDAYARFAAVIAASTFFQQLLDLTIEEALVKFGFRYVEGEQWGRLRRLFQVALAFKLLGGLLAALAICALAPFSRVVWGTGGVVVPMLIASLIALFQSPENVAAGAIILRGRYDIRGGFQAVSMGLRLVGLAIGCRYGVVGAVIGMVVAQVLCDRLDRPGRDSRLQALPGRPDRADRRGLQAAPELPRLLDARLVARLGAADARNLARPGRCADRRDRLLPQRAGAGDGARRALRAGEARDADRADARLRGGKHDRVLAMHRRYVRSTGALMVVVVPVLWIVMPFLIGLTYGPSFRAHATDAARLVLVAAALQLVWGWTKSFPVSIGRPGPACVHPGPRDRGLHPAAPRLRLEVGGDRCGGGDARLDRRLLRCLVDRAAQGQVGLGTPRSPSREDPRRLGDLAARRGRARLARPGGGGVPAGPRARGRGGDHRRRRAGARALPGALGQPDATARRAALATVRLLRSLARRSDVVYTTGMLGRSSLGSLLARTPFVTKLTADPAYERARRWGLGKGSLEEFQTHPGAEDGYRCGSPATPTCAAPLTS